MGTPRFASKHCGLFGENQSSERRVDKCADPAVNSSGTVLSRSILQRSIAGWIVERLRKQSWRDTDSDRSQRVSPTIVVVPDSEAYAWLISCGIKDRQRGNITAPLEVRGTGESTSNSERLRRPGEPISNISLSKNIFPNGFPCGEVKQAEFNRPAVVERRRTAVPYKE